MIMQTTNQFNQLPFDEKLNVITHLVGAILSVVYLLVLIFLFKDSSVGEMIGIISFGLGSFVLYSVSSTYHLQLEQKKKYFWKKMDHISIYLLIGGSYTLFVLKYYDTLAGYQFLGFHWGLILLGIIFKLFYTGKFEFLSVLLYLVLGWMVVYIYEPITISMPEAVQNWLVIGGIFYTVGIIFYVWKTYKINHSIWHVFVLLGTFSHFFSYMMS